MSDDVQNRFLLLIDDMAGLLAEKGVGANDRVGVLAPNCVEYIAFVIACWQVGAVVVPVSSRYPVDTINTSLALVDCDVVFVAKEFAHFKLNAKQYRLEHNTISNAVVISCGRLGKLELDLNNDADIIFTSGSSGAGKAVVHTLGNHYYSALGSDANIPFGEGDTWLLTLPLYHISGFSLIMRALVHGASIAVAGEKDRLAGTILACDFSHVSLVPTQLGQLMSNQACLEKLRSLKAILVGGAATQTSLIKKAVACELPIYTTYGSTEMCSQVTTTSSGGSEAIKGSSGSILPYRQLRIACDGEICVKGETLFKGYVEGGTVSLSLDEDGYFCTGDIGSVDAEGNLYVGGRADNMFISGGENIYPEQIERAISEIETVEAVVVVGVDCEKYGRRPVAFIKMLEGLPFEAEVIRSRLGGNLEGFKIPIAFYQWPKDVSAVKPSRKFLRDLAGESTK